MPIYAYRCAACGHAKDALQKLSDPVLTDCPACGAAAFSKQVTAAGFQLKGSGWYVTDFRGGNTGGAAKPEADAAAPSGGEKADAAAPSVPATPATATSGAAPATAPPPAAAPAASKPDSGKAS
jgi:putative FmdB family regulatory protein